MKGLEKSAKSDTKGMIFTIVLYAIGASSVPYVWMANLFGGGKELEWIIGFIAKTLCAILPVYLIFEFGFSDILKFNKRKLKSVVFTIPALLIMVNNLPIVPLISSDMSIIGGFWQFLPYGLFCLSIGILEETTFRGTILPLLLYKFPKDKRGTFWAVILSSAIFGASHLVNLLAGFSPAVFLQVGYSFLIGAVCGFALIVSGNIYLPILFHAVFDIGGFMLSEGLAVGTLWTVQNIIWTAVFSILMGIVIVLIFIKKDFSHLATSLNLCRVPEEEK